MHKRLLFVHSYHWFTSVKDTFRTCTCPVIVHFVLTPEKNVITDTILYDTPLLSVHCVHGVTVTYR